MQKRRWKWKPLIFVRNMAIVGLLLFFLAGAALSGVKPAEPGEQVTIRTGDTLWTIASQYRPNRDPRETIHDIVRLNGLKSKILQPGTVLNLP